MIKFQLVEIDTLFPLSFFLCTYIEMFSSKTIYEKITSEKYFYFELSSKPNVDIVGITVPMRKMSLKPYSILIMSWIFNM